MKAVGCASEVGAPIAHNGQITITIIPVIFKQAKHLVAKSCLIYALLNTLGIF